MKHRQFGSTGFKVSALGMGCMRLPTKKFNPVSVDYAEAIKVIRRAIDLGVKDHLQDGYREKIHLVTKLPMILVRKAEDFERYLMSQLERLRTTYLDTYLFHSMNESELKKIEELGLIKKMEQAKKDKLINFIGFSFHDTLPIFKKIGVNIPQNFAFLNAANSKPNNIVDSVIKWMTKRKYKKLAKNEATVDKENPNGNALLCTECGKCVPKCPQTIKIPEELKKVEQVLGKNKKIKNVFK